MDNIFERMELTHAERLVNGAPPGSLKGWRLGRRERQAFEALPKPKENPDQQFAPITLISKEFASIGVPVEWVDADSLIEPIYG